jgi:hypothetical protein
MTTADDATPHQKGDCAASALDPDKCAARAEILHRQLNKIGRQQLDAGLNIGVLLTQAKEQLGHGKFGHALKRWRDEGIITFSNRSGRRWMLLAKYQTAIKSAKLANLHEAEKLAQTLEKDDGNAGTAKDPAHISIDDAVKEMDDRMVKALRKMRAGDHRQYLRKIIDLATSRMEALDA